MTARTDRSVQHRQRRVGGADIVELWGTWWAGVIVVRKTSGGRTSWRARIRIDDGQSAQSQHVGALTREQALEQAGAWLWSQMEPHLDARQRVNGCRGSGGGAAR